MLKSLGAFLLLFWFLSLLVHAGNIQYFFGCGGMVVFLGDMAISYWKGNARPASTRREIVL